MDKFFTVLKENGLIMNFVFFCVVFFNYRRRIGANDEVKKHPAKKQGVFLFKKDCEKGQLLHI
jgi:hypothetical protein